MAINKVKQWPAWSEYKVQGTTEANDPEYLAVKKEIIERYGADALYRSWVKVCLELENVTEEIAAKGNSMIPIFDTAEIISGGFTDEQQCEIKRVGAFVCRGTIPESETNLLYDNLKTFIKDNKQSIPAWPESSPSMYVLHNSPTQNALRSHPNHLNLQRALNSLWHDATNETSAEPLLYLDGVRDREPGQAFLGLGPHIDAGSLCRWSEPIYRKTYENIFAGNPEKHDAFDLTIRKDADQEKYKGPAHSGVLRSFQGWTALTPAAPREGTIMVYPNVKTAIAYMLLRPFFNPPADPADIMDASKWKLDTESSWFPGTTKPQSQYLSRSSHPHLRLEECLVYMPKVQPGDTVWWHCDVRDPAS
ncbi:hypothetical protein K4F52_003324 [Lecanicillium sp. MT-2017a]|nr:hypothetical protein K4F52_003324 [Lecanicillium sp. MT-2017a]